MLNRIVTNLFPILNHPLTREIFVLVIALFNLLAFIVFGFQDLPLGMNVNTVTFISSLATLVLILVVNNLIAKYGCCFNINWRYMIIILVVFGIPFSYFLTKSLAPFFCSQPIYLLTFHLLAISLLPLIFFLLTLVPLTISVFVFFHVGLMIVSYLGTFLAVYSFLGCLIYLFLSGKGYY